MARKRKVELDGAEFTITPLTFSQVEAWARQREDLGLGKPDFDITTLNPMQIRKVAFESVICPSLNNAKEINGEWNADRVADEMDKGLYDFLFGEIMKFMGYATQATDSPAEVKQASGESNAAS